MGKYALEKTMDSNTSHAVVFAVLVETYCVNTFHLQRFFTMQACSATFSGGWIISPDRFITESVSI